MDTLKEFLESSTIHGLNYISAAKVRFSYNAATRTICASGILHSVKKMLSSTARSY